MRTIQEIPLSQVNRDRHYNLTKAFVYALCMDNGAEFPPIHVARVEGEDYLWRICDGGHRTAAARMLGRSTIRARFYVP